jgi:transposase
MKYYVSTTEFNCGIDLHARQMYVCLMDRAGKILVHTNIRNNDFEYFLKLVAPYRHDLTVCAECMFGWYWLADACHGAGLKFVLAHALYLRAIHGGKNKNDRIDSEKLAHLLRTNLIPPGYVYPANQRPLRALLRQRLYFVGQRADLLTRLQSHQLAHNRPTLTGASRHNREPWVKQLATSEADPVYQFALQNQLTLVGHFDQQIRALDTELQHQTKKVAARDYALLQTIPGIGVQLAATLLYEIGDIQRFPTVKDFLSYSRLVKGTVASAGKLKGLRGAKLGNPYLRWALGEAAVIAKRDPLVIGPLAQRLEAKMNGNKFKANTVLAIKLARAVYYMLRTGTGFDPDRLVTQLTRKKSDPGARQPGRLTGREAPRPPHESPPQLNGTPNPAGGVGGASRPPL